MTAPANKAVVCRAKALVKIRRSFSIRFWAVSRPTASGERKCDSCHSRARLRIAAVDPLRLFAVQKRIAATAKSRDLSAEN